MSAPTASPPNPDPHATVRGMTISCEGDGLSWGSDTMAETLDRLASMGVNWVSIHPYGGLRGDGTIGRSRIDRLYEDPTWLTRAIDESHRRGLKIMIKPHLAYWGSPFSWRGEVEFENASDWQRFFATYEAWILKVAELSTAADAFVVGTELDRTVSHEQSWRRIIAAVRGATDAPLTYAAGWDAYESIPFWDALDIVGVQAYFPLVEHEDVPTDAEIRDGWRRIVARLESFGRENNRRVVLGELGYNRSLEAAVRPWSYHTDSRAEAEVLQASCLDIALEAVRESEAIVGAFLWKWFPGEPQRGNFRMSAPAMRHVIVRHWESAAPKP